MPLEALAIFAVVITVSLYVDIYVHRKGGEVTVRSAALWSCFWIAMALGFYVYVAMRYNRDWANLYLTGYVLEKSLSVDNLVAFMAIFSSFAMGTGLQHRILYYGILGALVFRAIFVVVGTGLMQAGPWVGFVFAAVVLWSAVKMLQRGHGGGEEITDYTHHWSVRLVGRLMPVCTRLMGQRFFVADRDLGGDHAVLVTRKGRCYATPAFLCLMAVETSDIAFSFDSVPAVIAVTREPILVYAAMIFAILGLRSLYFILAALSKILVHLEKAVIGLLFFIAFKLALEAWNKLSDTGLHISPMVSLLIVLCTLGTGVLASFVRPAKE